MLDQPTYPDFGNIYPGDYYPDIPWEEYIHPCQALPEGPVFDIRDWGAKAEVDWLNTEAIAACCRACAQAGGGVILVEGGSYVTGTVRLPSNCTLFIAHGSALVASRDVDQLLTHDDTYTDDRKGESIQGALLLIDHAAHVTVTGGGKICGSGEWYVYEPRQKPALTPFPVTMLPRRDQVKEINTVPGSIRTFYRDRIRYSEDKYGEGKPNLRRPSAMVWVQESRDVTFQNIVLEASMSWTLHVDRCDGITVRDMVINDNRHVANADGIDLGATSHALVEHCFVSCADDGIVLKNPGFSGRSMEDVTIRRCTVLTVMNAFKIGTETGSDIRHVLVEDCDFIFPDIYPGSVSGISLESCDGTVLEDVIIRRIRMKQVVCPLYIALNRRNRYRRPYTEDVEDRFWGGHIRNITIEDVTAKNCELPCIITGYESALPGEITVRRALEDITVRNLTMVYRDNEEKIFLPEKVDELLFDYPESNAYGDVPACGVYARHVDGLTLTGLSVTPRRMNTRPDVALEDVRP